MPLRFQGKHALSVAPAPEPSSINWYACCAHWVTRVGARALSLRRCAMKTTSRAPGRSFIDTSACERRLRVGLSVLVMLVRSSRPCMPSICATLHASPLRAGVGRVQVLLAFSFAVILAASTAKAGAQKRLPNFQVCQEVVPAVSYGSLADVPPVRSRWWGGTAE